MKTMIDTLKSELSEYLRNNTLNKIKLKEDMYNAFEDFKKATPTETDNKFSKFLDVKKKYKKIKKVNKSLKFLLKNV